MSTFAIHPYFRKCKDNLSPVLALLFLCLCVDFLFAQPSATLQNPELDTNAQSRDKRRAAIPGVQGLPEWTEADLDADVAKRPRFRSALARARISPGIGSDDNPDLSGEQIPVDERIELQCFLEQIITERCLPSNWDVAMHAGFTRIGSDVMSRHIISWQSQFGTIVASRSSNPPSYTFTIRVRVSPEHRLVMRPDASTGLERERSTPEGKNFFDGGAFHALLSGVLRVPFEGPVDFAIHLRNGAPRVFEEVRIADGIIRTQIPPDREMGSAKDSRWYRSLKTIITDSEPQYFAVTIDFRSDAKGHECMR
jgi:hypothetical protein